MHDGVFPMNTHTNSIRARGSGFRRSEEKEEEGTRRRSDDDALGPVRGRW
jgi:hypothetical protein